MSIIKVALATLCALCLWAMPTFANEVTSEVTNAPVYAVGDAWVLERTDGYTGVIQNRSLHEVVSIDEKGLTISFQNVHGRKGTLLYTNEGNFVRTNQVRNIPYRPALKFPLSHNASWTVPFKLEYSKPIQGPQRMHDKFEVSYAVKVVARELVRVPAGTFNAWKLESYMHLDGYLYAVETYWYAPEVKRTVRQEFSNPVTKEKWIDVLVAYRINGKVVAPEKCGEFGAECILAAGPSVGKETP